MAFGLHTVSLVLLFISFVFLLLTTISAPIIKSFPLGKTDIVYGIFGYCPASSSCSSATYPWTFPTDATNWLFANDTRNQLNKAVILAPITLGLVFFNLISVIVLHFKNKLKVISIILNLLVLLCLIALSVILILLYHPWVGWLTWCLLGSAVLSIISFVFLILASVHSPSSRENASDLTSLNQHYIDKNFDEKFPKNIGLPHTRQDDSYGFKVANNSLNNSSFNKSGYNNSGTINNPNRTNTLTNTSDFNSHVPTQSSDFIATHAGPNLNENGNYYNEDRVSGINTVGTSVLHNKHVAPALVPDVATITSIEERNYDNVGAYQAPYPTHSAAYDQSVFEHHPEVEGHKPFTELGDDIDDDGNNHNGLVSNLHLSDSESDFTSISQRGYNQDYNNPNIQQNVQYPHVQQFTPTNQQFGQFNNQNSPHRAPQQFNNQPPPPNQFNRGYAPNNGRQQGPGYQPVPQTQQPPQQARSDGLLNNNPDFNIVGPSKRKQNSGFVPVAARYKNQPTIPSKPGNGAPSSSNAYSITR